MYILGISCFYHDASACLIKDGVVVAAAQEERFNYDKYSPVFPIQSINYCLQQEGITSYDIDHITFYEKMYLKFERTIISHVVGFPFTLKNFMDTMPLWLKDRLIVPLYIRDELTYNKKIWNIKHHLSHAASSYFLSPFNEAAILTVDGVGEYASATYGYASGNKIEIKKEISYPHSLGLLYSIVTAYLGFRVFSGEGKVMALAEFGEPVYRKQFDEIIDIRPDGSFCLNMDYFSFNRGEKMHNKKFIELFGDERIEDDVITERHKNIAATLQKVTEEAVLKMANHLYLETKSKNLCLAGGVFLNVTANSRILKETPFENVYIQPAAGDAGSAIGSALYLYHSILDNEVRHPLKNSSLGPSFSNSQIEIILKNKRLKYTKVSTGEDLAKTAARHLADGKVVAWFQGRMEFGPRALGNRSILADPRSAKMKDWLNLTIKHREDFRPFGASVLRGRVSEFFDFEHDSPYMLYVAPIKEKYKDALPAIAHVNGTSRIQTVRREENERYYDVINEFAKLTDVPMVLNTSLNDTEPIVCTPQSAIDLFLRTKMDILAIEDFIVEK
ncbi:MAG: carbamoyltransferase [Bacteriovorax sp.]|jgi:carbamoyltransferase